MVQQNSYIKKYIYIECFVELLRLAIQLKCLGQLILHPIVLQLDGNKSLNPLYLDLTCLIWGCCNVGQFVGESVQESLVCQITPGDDAHNL